MSKLQDGLMLFTRDSRVVPGECIRGAISWTDAPRHPWQNCAGDLLRFLSAKRSCLSRVRSRPTIWRQREIQVSENRTMQVSLDFIREKGTPIGALLTMRDAESVRRIEDEIELSRRLSASARTTRSVAHEVKNPINAIVLHLQLLQNKLKQVDPDTQPHMDIIGNEIHRLDRVVQILVDFTRPRELRLEEIDLRRISKKCPVSRSPDAAQHSVTIERDLPEEPLMVKADSDFMKQAFLNVVLNGVQAMPDRRSPLDQFPAERR